MIEHIYNTFEHLRDWRSLAVYAHQFADFAAAIHRKGAPARNIVGFVDGKLQHLARPGRYQSVLYNGNDCVHGFKWQGAPCRCHRAHPALPLPSPLASPDLAGVVLPNGMQPFPFGPICGSNHDAFMLQRSQLLEAMARIASFLGWAYALYGDLAYPNGLYLHRPFDMPDAGSWQVPLSPHLSTAPLLSLYSAPPDLCWQEDSNIAMSGLRVSVEWGFGKITGLFQYLNHEENLRLFLQPVGLYYPVANILANCHTTLYGSQTGDYFGVQRPSLEDYLNGVILGAAGS